MKISLGLLGVIALLQVVVVLVSGSVALLADSVHNFSDALTAVPLWVAFVIGRRPASRRYTYGFGRIEDLAGLFIVAMIATSAVVAGVESIRRFVEPQHVANLGCVLAAGLIGFAGNELVAVYRIRVGRRIGSAALVADGVDPGLVDQAERTVAAVPGIDTVDELRMRWSGHRLMVEPPLRAIPPCQ